MALPLKYPTKVDMPLNKETKLKISNPNCVYMYIVTSSENSLGAGKTNTLLGLPRILVPIITLGCVHLHSSNSGAYPNGYLPSLFLFFFIYVCAMGFLGNILDVLRAHTRVPEGCLFCLCLKNSLNL